MDYQSALVWDDRELQNLEGRLRGAEIVPIMFMFDYSNQRIKYFSPFIGYMTTGKPE